MSNVATLPPKSTEDFTAEPDRDIAEQSLTAPDLDAADDEDACPCPDCRSQDVARERGRSAP
jgi:hypothetical protein